MVLVFLSAFGTVVFLFLPLLFLAVLIFNCCRWVQCSSEAVPPYVLRFFQ